MRRGKHRRKRTCAGRYKTGRERRKRTPHDNSRPLHETVQTGGIRFRIDSFLPLSFGCTETTTAKAGE